MRISTNTVYALGIAAMQRHQESLVKTQQQLASGRRILTPVDDPVAAARSLEVAQAEAANAQYAINRASAKSKLALEEAVLQNVASLIQDVHAAAVSAGNPVWSAIDRANLAAELREKLDYLIGLANSTDSIGQYLFSGYQGSVQPFARAASGMQYAGDEGQRRIQVGAARQIDVADPGAAIFERIRNGNGVFVTAAAAANAGSGVVSAGSVTDAAALTGHSYEIRFAVSGGVTTYEVVDVTASAAVSTGNVYASGSTIAFDGIRFDIEGNPADGDHFIVTPSSNQSLFKTLKDLIAVLETPVNGAAGKARLTNGLNAALVNLDRALDNVLGIRASVGARLQELDALDSLGEDLALQYQQILSQLQDVDYAQAISDLSRQQTYLEAAQRSFLRVSALSLFEYL